MFILRASEDVLIRAGYEVHKDGVVAGGYVRYVNEKDRFHAKIVNDKIEVHFDKTIKGFHNSAPRPRLESMEKKRLKSFIENYTVSTKKTKSRVMFAENLTELQKRKTASRSWWNPMRFIRGDYYEIK